ncbi:MAG: hypothetical protein IJE70_03530 [Oscillospiraceae bacterium]|nr:hypothetical protein [Oscillospiraceae bacterium]
MKKLIALTLALAMVLTLAPSVFAADTGWEWAREAKSFVYDFTSYSHEGTDTTDYTKKNSVQTVEQKITNTKTGYQKWGFVNMQNDAAGYPYTQTTYMVLTPRINGNGPVYDPDVTSNAGYAFPTAWRSSYIFELDIEESGTYNPTIDYTTYVNSPIVDIYLVEKPANGDAQLNWYNNGNKYNVTTEYTWTLPSTARIGKGVDMQQAGSGVKKSAELLPVTLDESKNYYLIFIPVGITNNPSTTNDVYNDARIFLRSLTLSQCLPQDAEKLSYVLKVGSLNSKLPRSTDSMNGIWNGTTTWNFDYFDWNTTSQLVADATAEKGVSVDETIEPYKTLDLAKTAPFKIDSAKIGSSNAKVDTSHIYKDISISYCKNESIASRPHLALRLNVPYAGQYKLEVVKVGGSDSSTFAKVYFGKPADGAFNATDVQNKITSGEYEYLGWYVHTEGMYTKETTAENKVAAEYYTVNVPSAGEYHLIFDACADSLGFNSNTTQYFRVGQVNLIPVPGTLSEAEVEINTIKATMTADIVAEPTESAPTTATVNLLTRDIDGNADINDVIDTLSGNVGTMLTANADEVIGDYEFMYWEKGIGSDRRVVCYEPEYTFKATSGGAWLTAVYRNTNSDTLPVTFYNAIGDELSTALYSEGDTVTVPSVPAFENYTFTGWKCAETGDVYADGDAIIAEGKQMRIVAQYEDVQTANIAVSVTGGTGAGTYTYGDTVKVSATERENGNGSKVFVYWTKDGEIVSFAKTYTFLAAQNCNLVAVYEDYKPSVTQELRRIIISGNFAEFIGLDDASEKGVLFNENGGDVSFATATHKIAMTGEGNQLKFENDLGASSTMTGYAIVDGKVIYSK